MGRFGKYNNPSRKKSRRKPDYTERCIIAGKGMLIDYSLGYNPTPTTYKVDAKGGRA